MWLSVTSCLTTPRGAYASVSRDWCPVKNASLNETNVLLALEGEIIKAGASEWPPFSVFNKTTGLWSGYDIEVFREVARRGRFDVDFVQLDPPSENESWDDVLFTQGRHMDIMCTWWGETSSRKKRNIGFAYPILDQSLVLGTPVPNKIDRSFVEKFWVFLQPFSQDLWLTILFGNLFTAIIVLIIDPHINLDPWTNAKEERRMYETNYPTTEDVSAWIKYFFVNIFNFFYQGWVLGTAQVPYKHPRNPWIKIYLMSWTGVLIVMVAAYTAQLTTLLFVDLRPVKSIESIEDVANSGLPVCATDSVPHVKKFFLHYAPNVPVVSISTIDEAFESIRNNECAATVAGQAELELLLAGNDQCDMRIIGRTLKTVYGAYPSDTSNCGSFVTHVIGGLVQGIAEDGLLDDLWDTYINRPPRCTWSKYSSNENGNQPKNLELESMGGLFIIHAAITSMVLIGFFVHRYMQYKKKINVSEHDSFFQNWRKFSESTKSIKLPSITKDMTSFARSSGPFPSGDDTTPHESGVARSRHGGASSNFESKSGKIHPECPTQESPSVKHTIIIPQCV